MACSSARLPSAGAEDARSLRDSRVTPARGKPRRLEVRRDIPTERREEEGARNRNALHGARLLISMARVAVQKFARYRGSVKHHASFAGAM